MKAREVREKIFEKKELTYEKIMNSIKFSAEKNYLFFIDVETNLIRQETFNQLKADGYNINIDIQNETTRIDWSVSIGIDVTFTGR